MIVSRSKYLLLRGILYHEFDINNCLVSITDETISRQRCVAFEHEKFLMETVNTQRECYFHLFRRKTCEPWRQKYLQHHNSICRKAQCQ